MTRTNFVGADAKPGQDVLFVDGDRTISRFGSCTHPVDLIIGSVYTIESVDVHRQHTRLTLVGKNGTFNSAHFDYLEDAL